MIKLEGMPKGHTFHWVDDEATLNDEAPELTVAPDPPDACPLREGGAAAPVGGAEDDMFVDDDTDDEEDEDDVPPAERIAPAGFKIVETFEFAHAALEPKAPEQAQLVGKSILLNWASVGWCVGVITEANRDARRTLMIDDEKVMANFFVYYEIDENTAKHRLLLEQYGGEDVGSWVLLEAETVVGGEGAVAGGEGAVADSEGATQGEGAQGEGA